MRFRVRKSAHRPGAHRPCDGGRGLRAVRRRPCRLQHRRADLAGLPARHDDRRRDRLLSRHRHAAAASFIGDDDPQIDAAEFLSAVGTFCATLTAFFSVGIIILREEPHIAWTWLIMIGWVAGIAMQIVAGAKARMRR